MKTLTMTAAVVAGLLYSQAAPAQTVGRYERYCLNVSEPRGGASPRCRYATYQQCMDSRTANGEWCMENPAIGFARQRSRN
jgi:hypothetical protein